MDRAPSFCHGIDFAIKILSVGGSLNNDAKHFSWSDIYQSSKGSGKRQIFFVYGNTETVKWERIKEAV